MDSILSTDIKNTETEIVTILSNSFEFNKKSKKFIKTNMNMPNVAPFATVPLSWDWQYQIRGSKEVKKNILEWIKESRRNGVIKNVSAIKIGIKFAFGLFYENILSQESIKKGIKTSFMNEDALFIPLVQIGKYKLPLIVVNDYSTDFEFYDWSCEIV
jgi:hypothetical protein